MLGVDGRHGGKTGTDSVGSRGYSTVHGATLIRAPDMGRGREDAIAINKIMLCEQGALSAMNGTR